MDSATPPTLPPGDDAAGTIPQQRDREDTCQFCQRHPRWTDTRFGHPDGWRLCTHCITAFLDMNRRLADAMQRMEPSA